MSGVIKFLTAPLPNGSKRARSDAPPHTPPSSSLPESQRKKPRTDFTATSNYIFQSHLTIKCDGACRNNGSPNAEAAYGIFVQSYDCPLSSGACLPHAHTNNAAEIIALDEAVRIISSNLAALQHVTQLHFFSDSSHVVSTILSGSLYRYQANDRFPNSILWQHLAATIKQLEEATAALPTPPALLFTWIPRYMNREADEIANSALDQRAVNTNITSTTPTNIDIDELSKACLQAMPKKRWRFIRALPASLYPIWQRTVQDIVLKFPETTSMRLFILLPILLALPNHSINNRHAFKALRTHMQLLPTELYLAEHLAILLVESALPIQPTDSPFQLSSNAINTMCKRGLHAKLLKRSNTHPVRDPTTIEPALRSMFPTRDTIQPPLTCTIITFGWNEYLSTLKSMRKGAAPGISGWCRELLLPLFFNPHPSLAHLLLTLLNNLNNDMLPPDILPQLSIGILIPLKYDNKDKIRPITISDFLLRVVAKTAIRSLPVKLTNNFVSKCLSSIATTQTSLDNGHEVLLLDGKNTYNEISRLQVWHTLKNQEYEKIRPIMNILYASPSTIRAYDRTSLVAFDIHSRTGTRQGCTTGNLFLALTLSFLTDTPLLSSKLHIVADDIALSGPNVLADLPILLQRAEHLHLHLQGAKSRLLSPRHPTDIPNFITLVREPTTYLGGILTPNNISPNQYKTFCNPSFTKATERVNTILSFPTSIQNKLAMLRILPTWLEYYVVAYNIPSKPSWVEDFFLTQVDELHARAFSQIVCADHHVQNHIYAAMHTEDGGFGILPLTPMRAHIHQTITTPRVKGQKSLSFHWRKLSTTRRSQYTRSWITTWPTNRYSTIEDDQFSLFYKLITNTLTRPPRFTCTHFDTTANISFSHHVLTCTSCCPGIFFRRHQAVLFCLKKTLDHHLIPTSLEHTPLPGNTAGGSDLSIFCSPESHEEIDISISTSPVQMFNVKTNKYLRHARLTGHKISPFIISHDAFIDTRTFDRVVAWATTTADPQQVIADIITNIQVALIRSTTATVTTMLCKYSNQ